MVDFVLEYYLAFKAAHIIAVISWMAGMLYLPRLFVYHTRVQPGSEAYELFKIMEVKLLRIIINPAMIVSWVLGGLMLYANPELMTEGWMHAKLTLLIVMQLAHAYMSRCRKAFVRGDNKHSEKFYRYFNEVPTVLMIGIVVLAVAKAF